MRIFNYIFYRITTAYKKWDNDAELYGAGVISLMLSSLMLSIINIIAFGFDIDDLINNTIKIYTVITLTTFFVNFFIFDRRRYIKISDLWRYEKHKKLKGWLIVFCVILCLCLFFITGARSLYG